MLYIAADHAGFPLKEELKKYLLGQNYDVVDLGAQELEPGDDYPDFAAELARRVNDGENSGGILICGTGQGVCIAANRFAGIRAALIYDDFTARAAAEHLDANVVCLGGRTTEPEIAKRLIKIWLDTEFSGEERHRRRIGKIEQLANSD